MDMRYIIGYMYHDIFSQPPTDGCLEYHSLRILNSYVIRISNIVLYSNLY